VAQSISYLLYLSVNEGKVCSVALLFVDGFDAGDFATKWSLINGGSTVAGGPYATGRYLYLNGGGQTVSKIIPASAQIFVGFSLNVDPSFSGSFLTFSADNGTVPHISVSYNSTQLFIHRNGTVLSTVANLSPTSSWYYIEVTTTIHDTTGICKVKVNGIELINFTGDTRNGGTSTNIDMITLARPASGGNSRFDDLYICDTTGSAPHNTFLGEVRINTLVPTAAGSDTGFTPSTGANYTTVDELPYSATDYVTATASGTRDLYAMSDVSGSYTVMGVQNNVIAKKVDAGGTAIKPAIKSGGTIYYGTSTALQTGDKTITDTRGVDPATSTAWTLAGVNNLESGMEIA
jgi:hypothetical protein